LVIVAIGEWCLGILNWKLTIVHHNRLTVSTPELRALNQPSKAKARATHLKQSLAISNRSLPSSPAFGASSPHLAPPLSAGLDGNMPWDFAVKKTLIHFLAVKPRSTPECRRAVRTSVTKWMDKIAKRTSANSEEWTLLDKSYKELDVWEFNYKTQEDRQAAVDNAIRAYDRMRLSKNDELWQKLLPKEERGQGKVLSRLNLQKGPLAGTPALKPKTIDRKTGLPKRTEPKKTTDKEAKAKKSKDTSEEEPIRVARSKIDARTPKPSTPKPDPGKDRKANKKEGGSTTTRKEVKASTAAKSLLNKPQNPSPLSASPPVNAADFEDDHPVHKALSAAVSPKRHNNSNKRKADDLPNGVTSHRTNGIKRKAHDSVDSDLSKTSTPVKSRKVNGPTTTNGHRSPNSDESSGSPPLALSWRQSLDLAKKFRQYYDRYAKLYMELSTSVEPPSREKREQLLSMHRKLEEMKREVRSGAL
jgi:RNA polymerase II elongation factor ELL